MNQGSAGRALAVDGDLVSLREIRAPDNQWKAAGIGRKMVSWWGSPHEPSPPAESEITTQKRRLRPICHGGAQRTGSVAKGSCSRCLRHKYHCIIPFNPASRK